MTDEANVGNARAVFRWRGLAAGGAGADRALASARRGGDRRVEVYLVDSGREDDAHP